MTAVDFFSGPSISLLLWHFSPIRVCIYIHTVTLIQLFEIPKIIPKKDKYGFFVVVVVVYV